MHDAPILPRAHVFVCTNRRPGDSPLGTGCADRGEEVFDALKSEIARRALVATVWVTKTQCLGICPREGATVALYPRGRLVTEVTRDDAHALLGDASREPHSSGEPPLNRAEWSEVEAVLVQMEELQIRKVFDLATRLKPGITYEDMRNPHDFPELDDTDWHFEDGVLSGIQSALSAVRARMREAQS